jgi:hypothetical protein
MLVRINCVVSCHVCHYVAGRKITEVVYRDAKVIEHEPDVRQPGCW